MSPRPGTPTTQLVALWRNGATLEQIAAEVGLTRQRVSQRLIEAGFSPAQRAADRRAAIRSDQHAFRAQRAESVARRVEERSAACDRIAQLAYENHVRTITLGQYVARTGAYSKPHPGTSKHAGMYGRGALPPRDSPRGHAIARRARQAAAPWSVQHIAQLAARRSG